MSLDSLPVNAFDLLVAAVLIAGILGGRKRGMSEELLSLLQWLAVVVGCSRLYDPVGRFVAEYNPFGLLYSFMLVYFFGAVVILVVVGVLRRGIGGKLVGSDIFGRAEYYLGMGSGLVRYSCILLAALALLNARYFTPAETKASENFQKDEFGSTFFPTWHSVQQTVFERSLAGPWIKQNLGGLLITPTVEDQKQLRPKEPDLP